MEERYTEKQGHLAFIYHYTKIHVGTIALLVGFAVFAVLLLLVLLSG